MNPEILRKKLLGWYATHRRRLPWRATSDPFAIWVSEVMLQQTQVATVLPYYQRFLERFPTLESLALSEDDEILKLWEGLGYYRRCHHFLKAVRSVVRDYNGQVPNDPKAFSGLSGVGEYTTAAVMSIAFGHPLPVVDGNVIRVMARYHCISNDSTKTATRKTIRQWMERFIPDDQPGDFNQAVMELGATVCLPRQALCGECPLHKGCCARESGCVTAYPVIPKKEKIPEYQVGLAVIRKGRTFLIQKRPSTGHLAGMWEFPGGKARAGEDVKTALKRKCMDELGVSLDIGECIARVTHVYSHFKIKLSVFLCTIDSGRETPFKNQPVTWITTDQIDQYAFPSANHKFFESLRESLS